MCGIVGVRHDWLTALGRDPDASVRDAVATMAWRGPDGQQHRRAGGWWLGCARLAISGPGSHQPVTLRGGSHTAVLNGAIANARALFDELLPRSGRREHVPNDAWLPALTLARARPADLARLRGHHAYAVHCADRDELVIGQDRFAEKPLSCLLDRRGGGPWRLVAFASTVDALVALGMPRPQPCPRRLAEWFRFGWDHERPHRFSSRLQLTALPLRGQPLTVQEGPRTWWRPTIDGRGGGPSASGDRRQPLRADDLADRLAGAVRDCVDTPSRAALSLSGGIDSSCLALAAQRAGAELPCYQFRAEGAPEHERHAARAAARSAGLELRPVDAGPELLDHLPELVAAAGRPLGDPSVLAVHAVARAARRDGNLVLLGGEGADELLLGYRRYRLLARLPRLPRAFGRAVRGWSLRPLARALRAAAAENPVRALLAVTPPAFGHEVLAPALARRACWHDREPLPGGIDDPALRGRADDLEHYLPRDLLPKLDVASLAAGVEARCPFLVADLTGFGERRHALGKRELRQAFAARLPREVEELPKAGFSLPLDAWFRRDLDSLDLLTEPRSRERPHLRPGGLARAVDRHRRGGAALGHALFLLLSLELHLRRLEGPAP